MASDPIVGQALLACRLRKEGKRERLPYNQKNILSRFSPTVRKRVAGRGISSAPLRQGYRPSTIEAFTPPKPKAFERTTPSGNGRPLSGT